MNKQKMMRIVITVILLTPLTVGSIHGEELNPLYIYTPSSVEEGQTFFVIVRDQYQQPIRDATVTFVGTVKQTSGIGTAVFTAPTVEQTTNYPITANKTGYQDAVVWLPVVDTGFPPERQLSITAPSSVIEGDMFQVTVTANNTPMSNVVVIFNNNYSPTNEIGQAVLRAPEVVQTTSYPLTANKSGYQNATVSILIENDYIPEEPPLQINSPSSVIEGEQFQVRVTIAVGIPVSGATVEFLGQTYASGGNGIVQLTAPQVSRNTSYSISAKKTGYQEALAWVLIRDYRIDIPSLTVSVPASVNEGEQFQVRVTIAGGIPVSEATIELLGKIYNTGGNGVAEPIAPVVNQHTNYSIRVNKTGYQDVIAWILVLNQEPEQPTGWIQGMVTTTTGQPLENVLVCALRPGETTGECIVTDSQGLYNLTLVPDMYTISARKNGFIENHIYGIILQRGVSYLLPIELEKSTQSTEQILIEEGIHTGRIGGEITITKEDHTVQIIETIYAKLNISSSVDTLNKTISLIISGEEQTGKTIALRINHTHLPLTNITITYDDVKINKATDIIDILDANDDGALPEYYIVITDNILLISIPHFSEHTIFITVEETLTTMGINILLLYTVFCGIAILMFIGSIKIRKRM